MPRTGWLLLIALAGCQSVATEKAEKPADDDKSADRFGPTPARVELTPAKATVAPGKDQLFVASVFDDTGEPRRNRRVDWKLAGPGEIVAVADAGWLPGRSRVTDKAAAVSYTEFRDRSTKRGDGVTTAVKAGQAWCRVRGADTDTTLTATVADVPDPARRSATALLTAEPGGRTTGPKSRAKEQDDDVPDRPKREPKRPPPAEADDRDEPEPRPASRRGREDPAPRPTPKSKEPEDDWDAPVRPPVLAAGRGSAGRADRPAVLTLDVTVPPAVGIGQSTTVVLTAANRGGEPAQSVNLLARLPDGLELVRSDPPPAVRQGQDEKDLRWGLGDLRAGGAADKVTLTVRPTRRGEHHIEAAVEAGDGRRDDRDVPVTADDAGLKVEVEVPPAATAGDRVAVTVVVTNTGRVPVRHAAAFVTAGPELASDPTPKELTVGDLRPGETRRAAVKLQARQPGRPGVWASVTADGGLQESARGEVIVGENPERGARGAEPKPAPEPPADRPARVTPTGGSDGPRPESRAPRSDEGRPSLVLEVPDPPGAVPAGGRVRVTVRVRNRGTGPARNVELTAAAEGALVAAGGVGADRKRVAPDGGRVPFAPVAELRAGEVAKFVVELDGRDPGSGRLSLACRADHLSRPLKEEHEGRVVER